MKALQLLSEDFEDLELWYPVLRLREAGLKVDLAGETAGKTYHGKYGVPAEALQGRAITTAELWDERLRAVPTELRLSAYAAAALGDDIRGNVLKELVSELGMDANDALVALTRAQMLLASGTDQFRWAPALLQEHLLGRLHERHDGHAGRGPDHTRQSGGL